MKIKSGFELHDVCGEKVILAESEQNINFTKIISLNDTAAFLWKNIMGKDFTAKNLTETLLSEYEVTEEKAQKDVDDLIQEWNKIGLLDK